MKKLKFTRSLFLIFSFALFICAYQTVQAQQIPIGKGDTIEGQARNKKDIAHINPIISVRFIEALTPYLPIKKIFMPQTFRIEVTFKKNPQGRTQPIVLSKTNHKTGETKELFEVSLISGKINSKTFTTNPIGIKDQRNDWFPAEPYAFPLVVVSPRDVIQAAIGNQKAQVKATDTCNFLNMGIFDIEETIQPLEENYKPWLGKLICGYITSDFKTKKNQTNFVKTVLEALSRNFIGEGWSLNPETKTSSILTSVSSAKKSHTKIKKATRNSLNQLSNPLSDLFDNSSKIMDENLLKAEKAILTIFKFKKVFDLEISLKKTKVQRKDLKKIMQENISAFKKEHLIKLNNKLILASERQ